MMRRFSPITCCRRDFIIHCDDAPYLNTNDVPPPVKLVIHPMAAPRPSLKYQLLPPFETRIRGNAAVYCGKVTAEHLAFFTSRELQEKIEN